ncbi:MAG: protein phosphatase 2C domain-containing protein [Oscillatoria princeps RMCB-10]|jgi:serine/threonine protein phosphatase PrpC|nr:protein phosphatase 2C domain-containing protein [Oscillatoria princeps RMCB-10]
MATGFSIGDRILSLSGDTHPDYSAAHATLNDYLIVGASAVGKIHLAKRTPRDDAFAIRSYGPWVAVGVSDGVGSRPLSRYGATYVAEALASMLLRRFVPPFKSGEQISRSLAPLSGAPERVSRLEIEEMKLDLPDTEWESDCITDIETQIKQIKNARLKEESETQIKALMESLDAWNIQDEITKNSLNIEAQQAATAGWGYRNISAAESRITSNPPDLSDVVTESFQKVQEYLKSQAKSLEVNLSDLSCTALGLLLNVETGELAVGQIGDGAVLGLTAKEKLQELVREDENTDPQSTHTINNSNFEKHLKFNANIKESFSAFFIMTDGVSNDLLYSSESEIVTNWFGKINSNLLNSPSPAQAAAGLLNYLATYQVPGSFDDRTLVVITRKNAKTDAQNQPATGQSESAQTT